MRNTRLSILIAVLVASAFALGWALNRGEPARTEHVQRDQPNRIAAAEKERDAARQELFQERARTAKLEEELIALREKAEQPAPEPEPVAAPAPEKPKGPPTKEEMNAAIAEFGDHLGNIIRGNEKGREASAKIRALLQRAGPEGIRELLANMEDDTESMGTRVVIAHALAQSYDPVAIEALTSKLRTPDAGLMMHRFASHALAFSDADGVTEALLEAAHHADDRGTRANSSFGLARRGDDEGIALYFKATDEAFQEGDPAALQYLSGLQLLGPKALPAARERLLTYTNDQAMLVLISAVKTMGDRDSVPTLEKLANDNTRSKAVRNAAAGALRALQKTN